MPLHVVRHFWGLLALVLSSASKLAMLSLVLLNLALAGLTVATVISDRVFGFLSSIVEGAVDVSTVGSRHKAKVAQLETDLSVEKGRVAGVQTDLDAERRKTVRLEANLKATQAQLDGERKAKDALKADVSRLDGELTAERGKAAAKADIHRRVAGRFRSRAQRMAGANVAAIFGEAVPVYGVGIIVSATTYELTETCLMMRDMDELAALFEGQPVDETTNKVCGMTVPSMEEVWDTLAGAPEDAWKRAQEHLPTEVPAPPSFDWKWFSSWAPQHRGWLSE